MSKILKDHNGGVTGDTFSRYVRELSKNDKDRKEVGDRKKDIEKRAKDDGVDVEDLRWAVKQAKDDPQVYIDRLNRRRMYLGWLRSPLGESLPMIDDVDDTLGKTEEERAEAWKGQGFRAGLAAENRDTCPHQPDSPGFQAWMEGYQEGQDENLKGITAPASKRGRGKKSDAPPAPPPPPVEEAETEGDVDGKKSSEDEDWDAAAPK